MVSKLTLATAALAVFSVANAFVVNTNHSPTRLSSLSMSDGGDKEEPTLLKTVLQKQLAWDEKKGRFFETSIDEEDCIPEEEFCVTDKDTGDLIRLTVEEKERIFMDAMQAYYSSGRKILDDGEFDLLKEDLTWYGSSVVVMNRRESAYMKALQDYLKGTPSMTDAEFDTLKVELQEEGSRFAVQTEPKCFIDSGICKVTMTEDFFRTNLLYLPAGFAMLTVWLGLTFELLNPLIKVNPLFLGIVGTPFIYTTAKTITENFLFENFKIARGACPSCSYENTVFFGNILGVEGFNDVAAVKCPNCKEVFNVQRNTLRASTKPKA
mmetsp:Transcript_7666/g.10027  ORF Transcript_7666/g.10027 Transcript_7666/m.10027 type:complete len:323 (+) Transcript_7666:177-1145(+)|eukprot:CAMPEP_0198143188 /NCGR_PEP_ID=MMETSP1443-20131203/5941_1 /TAXON_ID=186043 /ORGANISM="Entomoneis sp., Strain CCMP2396" /LENGTH=322 /DNA_ID=CAMNT_0043806371 /DNA_START=95 /DNA_END=1066 /DNA_ORIENTATION=-